MQFPLRSPASGSSPCRRRGATTVEVALTFPLLMLILTFSIEAARLNTLRNTIENAAYEGARRGIIPGASATDVQTIALKIMKTVNAQDVVVSTNPSTITSSTRSLTVTIDVPLASNSWVGKPTARHMIRSCTLSRERTE